MKVKSFQIRLYKFLRLAERQRFHDYPEVAERLDLLTRWKEACELPGVGVERAAELVGSSTSTLYRWQERLRKHGLKGLRKKSCRPRRCRQASKRTPELRNRIVALRKKFGGWGKQKLVVLLREEGFDVSESTVGRVLLELLLCGRITRSCRKIRIKWQSRSPRPHATRGYLGLEVGLGEVVQLDTMTVKPHYGFSFKQFTAIDVCSRYLVAALFARARACDAEVFLAQILDGMPFPVKAIQVDGGSEFRGEFEEACCKAGVELCVIPPASPQMNSRVEYTHLTCRREFYDCTEIAADLASVRKQFAGWVDIFNRVRPHASLGLKTPIGYIESQSASG